jgi:hypothetical protein
MRLGISVFLAVLVTVSSGLAQESSGICLLSGPSYQLASDTVEWTMSVGRGQSCVRGLRGYLVATLDSISLISPPASGQVKLEGPAFLYRANPDFRGQDSFVMSVSGKLNRINGTSTIRVVVSVR